MALGGQAQGQRRKMPSQHVEAATKVTPFAAILALIRSDIYVINMYICIHTFVCERESSD